MAVAREDSDGQRHRTPGAWLRVPSVPCHGHGGWETWNMGSKRPHVSPPSANGPFSQPFFIQRQHPPARTARVACGI